ncbi:MAG: hypothetical protein R2824_06315 [Saprospiraceae bacterium]|nr:hypothetical protein [Lewinella sp.]
MKMYKLFLVAVLSLSATMGFGQLYAPGAVQASGNANVGVNVSTPSNELQVLGTVRAKSFLLTNIQASAAATLNRLDGAAMSMGGGATQGTMIFDENYDFQIRKAPRAQVEVGILNAGTAVITVDGPTGNVGINTENPGSFQLAVEGTIGCREAQVLITNPFPDFVFESDYDLKSLPEVEQYIKENKHLPEIPSAAEVEEEGGFKLGEMNLKLLQKVEELTLYLIDQNKRIDQLSSELEKVKKENASLREGISGSN